MRNHVPASIWVVLFSSLTAHATVFSSVDIATNRLVRIDTDTMFATYVGPIGATLTDLAYDGRLCGITWNGTVCDRFVAISPETGAITYEVPLRDEVGREVAMAEGLAWDGASMRLTFSYEFGWSDHYGILNPTTGFILSSTTLPAMGSALGRADIDGLGMAPGGPMYGLNGEQAYTEIFDIDARARVGIDYNGACDDLWISDETLYAIGYQRLRTYDIADGKLTANFEISGLDPGARLEGLAVVDPGNWMKVLPTAMTVRLGRLQAGTVDSLAKTDGDAVVACKYVVPNQSAPPVNIEVEGVSPIFVPTALMWTVYSRMVTSGQYAQILDMWDWSTNAWDAVNVRSDVIDTLWVTRTLTGTNAGRYVRGDGTVRARVRVKRTGVAATALWCMTVEEAYWRVAP